MQNIPNMITSIRLVAALAIAVLCAAFNATQLFLPLFIAAGVSDMLDGFIARRCNWCTEFGARLDSISDLLLYIAVALFLIVHAHHAICLCAVPILIGSCLQLTHWAYCALKLGGFPAYHTDLSRLLAYLIFACTIAFWVLQNPLLLLIITGAWIACSLEGIIISSILRKRSIDVPNIAIARSRALAD